MCTVSTTSSIPLGGVVPLASSRHSHGRSIAWDHFLVADQVAFPSNPSNTAVPFMVVGLSMVPL